MIYADYARRKMHNVVRKRVKEYGVRWNGTASTLCDRLGNAVGLVANAHHGTADYVQNDFDSIYPWSDRRATLTLTETSLRISESRPLQGMVQMAMLW